MDSQKYRSFLATGILLLISSSLVRAQALQEISTVEHYLPGALNEAALKNLVDDDLRSAKINIERAYRLNPLSPDINANLEVIRNLSKNQGAYQVIQKEQLNDASGIDGSTQADGSIPAIWPRK